MKKILYLHGLGSKPGGVKPEFMKKLGFRVINPSLPDESFDESVRIARSCIDEYSPDLIIGSSRGGAIAMAVGSSSSPLLLICPAWKKFGVSLPSGDFSNTTILHSETDEIVPLNDSKYLHDEFGASLISCGDGHRMIDDAALKTLKSVVHSVLFRK
jgi:hypothetical protein